MLLGYVATKTRKELPITTLILVLLLILFHTCCLASPEESKKETVSLLALDTEFNPREGTYYYDVFLNGLKLGKGTIGLLKENGVYKIIVSGKTREKLSLLYKVRYRGEVRVEPSPLTPIDANIVQSSGAKKKEIELKFTSNKTIESRETRSENNKVSKIKEREVESDTFILDPFSTLLLLRQLDWHIGMAEVFDIYSGSKEYELRLVCEGVDNVESSGKTRAAWVIRPEITSIKKGKRKTRSNFKVYLSTDKSKEILKISGSPDVGKIVAKLRRFVPVNGKKPIKYAQ